MRRIVREVQEERLLRRARLVDEFQPEVVHRSVEYQSFGSRASSFAIASPFRNSFARGEPAEVEAARRRVQAALEIRGSTASRRSSCPTCHLPDIAVK